MKFLTVILAAYILALSFITCNDEAVNTDIAIDDVSFMDHQHSDEQHAIDLCSPFCSCSCCQVNLNTMQHTVFAVPNKKISTLIFSSTNNLSQEVNISVLQPPQV